MLYVVIFRLGMIASFGTWATILMYQAGHWLQYAKWPEYTILEFLKAHGLRSVPSDLLGLNIIEEWIFNLPVSVLPFIAGVLFAFFAIIAYQAEIEERSSASRRSH